jgi:hypothetical protein
MIAPVCPSNADFQTYPENQPVDFLKDVISISDQPFPFWNAQRQALHFIFELPKQKEFNVLVEKWHEERGATSSLSEMAICPSYQKIIGLGKEVAVPLILKRLEEEGDNPDFWFWALSVFDIDNPPVIPQDAQGKFKKMAQIWINWGRQNNANENWS